MVKKSSKDGLKKIADTLYITALFLAKFLQKLTQNKIISSIKGPNGGFYITTENGKKTIFDIINCIDDTTKFNQCYWGQAECNDENPCIVHSLYYPFKNQLIKKLKDRTILEMADEFAINKNISQFL